VVTPTKGAVGADLVGRSLPQPTVTSAAGSAGLDTHLGEGWTVLRVSGTAIEVLPLDGTAATTVAVPTPWLDLDRPMSVVVRPDRYVAAVTPPGEETTALRELARFLPALPAAYAAATRPVSVTA
jgi:hypothetical protein